MNLFSSSDEKRQKMHRKAFEQAIARRFAPLREQYVGRSFSAHGDNGPYTVKVDQIDDAGQVLLSFHRPGYRMRYVTVLSWDAFTQALAEGRMVAEEGV